MLSGSENHFIVVVSPGRSGQSSLAKILEQAYPNAVVAFEEPQIHYALPSFFQNFERKFRRKFIETNELLGRGKVLKAFAQNNKTVLKKFAEKKYQWILNKMHSKNSSLYFDVSKHFIHGLHLNLADLMKPNLTIVELMRDPAENMRSFLNRRKNFYLDNCPPDCEFNELWLDQSQLSKGQLYLHSWCECYLRARKYAETNNVKLLTINTRDLVKPHKVELLLKGIGLPFEGVKDFSKLNENSKQGFGETIVSDEDILDILNFCNLIPDATLDQFPDLKAFTRKKYGRLNYF